MSKANIITILLLALHFGSQGQNFEVTVDTVNININGRIGPSVMFNNKYLCFYETENPYSSQSFMHFYILSSNGTIENKIEVPDEMNTTYYDLHIRHDSIITKTYMNQGTFWLDPVNLKWIKIKDVDDLIFEDENLYATSLDFGEWGYTTWFKDKKTGIEYEAAFYRPRINKISDVYYVSTGRGAFEINDLSKMKKCSPDYYYSLVEKKDEVDGSESTMGANALFIDSTNDGESNLYIATSFVSNNQLYLLCSENNDLFISSIKNGKIVPIQMIAHNLMVYDYYYSYRCQMLKDNRQVLKFKDKNNDNLYGFIEIKGDKIKIHYLTNTYTEKQLGTEEAVTAFNSIFELIYSNNGNVFLNKIDSIEPALGGLDVTPHHKMSIGRDCYPNKDNVELETPRTYKKLEDSAITLLSNYYYEKQMGSVKVFFFEWKETKVDGFGFDETNDEIKRKSSHFNSRFQNLKQCITNKCGKPNKKKKEKHGDLLIWKTKNGLYIKLSNYDYDNYRHILLTIYKE